MDWTSVDSGESFSEIATVYEGESFGFVPFLHSFITLLEVIVMGGLRVCLFDLLCGGLSVSSCC